MPKILIVDDDKHTRALLKTIFEQDPHLAPLGLTVVTAGDGVEGLELFDREKPDLVVTDLLMPKMDGFRLCEGVRKREHGKKVGLIVVSGVYRDATVQSKVREQYGAQFFAKPYQLKELGAAIGKLLGRPAHTAEAEAPPALPPAEAMDGSFSATPLPRLLLDLYEARATGLIEIRRGRVEKHIDLVVGHPIAVSSNQRAEALGAYLVAKRVLDETQLQAALGRAADEEKKLGEALVELGFLQASDLVKHLTGQARAKITNALRWSTGVWTYKPNRDLVDRAKANALDPVAVVFLGLRNTAHPDDAAKAVERLGGRRVKLTPRGERLRAGFVRAFGEDALRLLADPVPAHRLLDDPKALPGVEALVLTGCAQAEGVERPATQPPVPRDPAPLASLSQAAHAKGPRPTLTVAAVPMGTPPMTAAREAALVAEAAAAPPGAARCTNLYDQLFGDEVTGVGMEADPPRAARSVPLAALDPGDAVPRDMMMSGDSGVVSVGEWGSGPVLTFNSEPPPSAEAETAREKLVSEFLRVQGKDWYAVLQVPRDAAAAAVAAAFAARTDEFALERHTGFDLGRDYAKLEEIHAAYRRAHEVLSDPEQRTAYDRRLGQPAQTNSDASSNAAMTAELAYSQGQRHLLAGDLTAAIARFRRAVGVMPDSADHHAALGWALHLHDQAETARGAAGDADGAAASHLAQALAIDPEHATAHEYLGRALAARGTDDEQALEHLEKALDARPPRADALAALAALRLRRKEPKPLERRYRLLLHRESADRALALRLWLALGEVYRDHLGDNESARTAYSCAARLAPNDLGIARALADLTAGSPQHFTQRAEALRTRWRHEPHSATPGLELLRAADEAAHHDTAWITAGVLVARGFADADATARYQRFRPRFLQRLHRQIDGELWPRLRHADDDPDVGSLFALLEPLAPMLSPLTFADLEVTEADVIADDLLPEPVARVRAYVADLLAVPPPRVVPRADFGDQVHVGAIVPPVLLVGPEVLAMTDRVALAYRFGRAMTYLWPGRATGGSRPSRVLKGMLLAAMSLAAPNLALDDPDGKIAQARAALAALPAGEQQSLKNVVSRLMRNRENVNLSRWARALARSGDRVGLLLCGDPVVAARGAATLGASDAVEDLLDWALVDGVFARGAVGLAIEV